LFTVSSFSFAQQNTILRSHLDPYPAKVYTDIWGYAANGREYAIIGVTDGTSFIDVTNPTLPVEVAFIPGPTAAPYHWREMKTHSHYAYIVTEGTGTGRGLQIIDLALLPDTAVLVNTIDTYFTRAHNITVEDGYAYVIGTNNFSGGLHILDLSNPVNPVQTATFTGLNYIHDVHVYNDTVYASAESKYGLINVVNKNSPTLVSSSAQLPGIYAHSGWLTEDKRYFIACEEFGVRDITVWDLQDRSSWDLVVPQWQNAGNSYVHNVFVKGNFAYVSYYTDGLVVLDVSNPENPIKVGEYDTYPGTGGNYDGAWGVYPYLPSGNIIVSDMSTGLYVIDFTLDDPTPVELISFSSSVENETVRLNWSTASELNNLGFRIERTSDKYSWYPIGLVDGHGTTGTLHQYSFIDKLPVAGKSYYRLVQTDYDGSEKIAAETEVLFNHPLTFQLKQNYPNPFNPVTTIEFVLPEESSVVLKIYNSLGELVKTLLNEKKGTGIYSIEFSADDLPSGLYIARIDAGSTSQSIKMSLLK
jgi:choice-of-anchor B domain-containing protein